MLHGTEVVPRWRPYERVVDAFNAVEDVCAFVGNSDASDDVRVRVLSRRELHQQRV